MSSAPTYHSTTEASSAGNKWVLPVALVGVVLLVALLIWLFRGSPDLDTGYGRRTGPEYRASVNGTVVFSEMFRQSGRNVTSIDKLSPKLQKYSTIVWFPDDFGVPTKEQREQLELWLTGGTDRTLIYVGRDYDAATAYWTRVLPTAPPEQATEIKRKLADAKSKFAEQRARLPKEEDAEWFKVQESSLKKVTKVEGPFANPNTEDAKNLDITLNSRLVKPIAKVVNGIEDPIVESLLSSEGDDLIYKVEKSEREWGDGGKIIVVTNGSMLLNYPLINKENRKIAGKLIAECAPDGDVAFLESGRGGPSIDKKSTEKPDREWPFPMNAIVFHLVMLSIVYCLARSAIFGRARELPADSPSDFGKHISALGKLMQRTKDQTYAFARLQQYRQHGKRDSGKTHKK
jgi:hypothetical protein